MQTTPIRILNHQATTSTRRPAGQVARTSLKHIGQRIAWLAIAFTVAFVLCLFTTDRSQAATLTVCASGCNHTTIQAAINAAVAGDTISIGAGTYLENLTIAKNITLQGASAATTIIDGNNLGRVITINSGVVVINDVTIQNGKAIDGAAGAGTGGGLAGQDGGGIMNQGTLTLSRSIVRNNRAGNGGSCTGNYCTGGLAGNGGGLYNGGASGTATISQVTFTGNTAGTGGVCNGTACLAQIGGYGGGIYNDFGLTMTVVNSTISGNLAGAGGACTGADCIPGYMGSGGGMYNRQAIARIAHTTITLNNAGDAGGLGHVGGPGLDSLFPTSVMQVKNSVIAGNTAETSAPDCQVVVYGSLVGPTQISYGGNVYGEGTGCEVDAALGDKTVAPALVFSTLLLQTLADNTGPTPTHMLIGGGAAVNNVPVAQCTDFANAAVTVDQRNVARPAGAACDSGAVEGESAPPLAVTINQAATQADPTNVSPVLFDVVFSAEAIGFDGADVTLGGTAGATTAVVTGSGAVYQVAVSGMTLAGTVIATIPASVASGVSGNLNLPSTSTDNTVTVDMIPPTVTINQAATQADPTNVSPVLFDVLFSEPVTGFNNSDIVLSGTAGATTAVVSGSGASYQVAVSGMTTAGTVIATINAGAAFDALNNPNLVATSTDNTVTYDGLPPTVTINQAPGQTDPSSVSPFRFSVVFNKPVTGFTNTDVVISGTAGANSVVVTGGPATYQVEVSGMTTPGTVIATIPAGAATDALGNLSAASTSTDNTMTYSLATGQITFVKVVEGGAVQPSAFTFNVVGGPQNIAHNSQVAINIGSYTVTENGPTGYIPAVASGACRLQGGAILLTVTSAGGVCTVTNTQRGVSIVESASMNSLAEGSTVQGTYDIKLLSRPAANVVVSFPLNPQVTFNKRSFTFTSSNWSTAQRVFVTVVDDNLVEGDGFQATIPQTVSSSDPNYNGAGVPFIGNGPDPDSNPSTVNVYIRDNDGSTQPLLISTNENGTLPGLGDFADEDIIRYDPVTNSWSMYFDGSDVGVGSQDVDAFTLSPSGTLLVSFDANFTLSQLYSENGQALAVSDADILEFIPTQLGANTAGKFRLYFKGSNNGLDTVGEDIDSLAMVGNDLIIGVTGAVAVPGVSGNDEDLLRCHVANPNSRPVVCSSWSLYFDGSTIGLTTESEDVLGVFVQGNDIYLSTLGSYSVTSGNVTLNGNVGDIIVYNSTASVPLRNYWNGRAHGLTTHRIDGIVIMPPSLMAASRLGETDSGPNPWSKESDDDTDDPDELDGTETDEQEGAAFRLLAPFVSNE
jgi:hypothetical protein